MSVNFFKNGALTKIARGLKDATVTITNNLLATKSGTALDAVQGKVLDDKITEVNSSLENTKSIVNSSSLYSDTEEVQIGTWIDGKPIYRKVVQITTPSTINTNKNHDLGFGVDTLIKLDAYCMGEPCNAYIENMIIWLAVVETNPAKMRIYVSSSAYINKTINCILEYTKA